MSFFRGVAHGDSAWEIRLLPPATRRRARTAVVFVALAAVTVPIGVTLARAGGANHELTSAPGRAPLTTQDRGASNVPTPGARPAPQVIAQLPRLGPGAPEPVNPPVLSGAWLTVPSVGISVAVTNYTDCGGGDTPMTHTAAVHFMCTPANVLALVAHNPGLFTPLLNSHAGDHVYYQDSSGTLAYTITSSQVVSPYEAAVAAQDSSFTHAVLTTCAAPDSSSYWVFIAKPDSAVSSVSGGAGSSSSGGQPQPQPKPTPAPSPSPTQRPIIPPLKLPH